MWKNASMRWARVSSDLATRSKSLRAVCTVPLAQRYCCALRGWQHVVTVQHQGLNAGEQAVIAVHVLPAGLHHADPRITEVADDLFQERRLRHEVGIEDGDQLTGSLAETEVERTG